MASRNFAWLAQAGGAWSIASNWADLTDGQTPSLLVPGAADIVAVTGETGGQIGTITGTGAALQASFAGNVAVAGSLAVGGASVGAGLSGGLLEIAAGGTLALGSLTADSGSVIANGAGAVLTGTAAVLGAGQSGSGAAPANLYATGGARVDFGTLTLDAGSAALYVDGASALEVGSVGGGALGALTIDAGAAISGEGDANAYGSVVNNGTVQAAGGTLLLGAVSGSGALVIGAGATLECNGRTGAGQAVLFAGAGGVLGFATEFDAPQGIISGFSTSDALDVLGSPISAATFGGTAQGGTLTLWYGSQVADTLTLAGNYLGDVFLTANDGEGGTLIEVAPAGSTGGTAPAGTSGPDQYLWVAAGGGAWSNTANWQDQTTGKTPAAVAPGAQDLDTVIGAQGGSFSVIDGPANAASLLVEGAVALSGSFSVGSFTLGVAGSLSGAGQAPGVLDLLPSSSLSAGSVAVAFGELSVGGSAVLTTGGTLVLGGGPSGLGLPECTLSVTAGGTVQAAGLTLGGGSGDAVVTDPTGVVNIGSGTAQAGAVTVQANGTLAGNGSVNPFGGIVDNGMILASGGTLVLGAVSGSGALSIGANAALVLEAGTGNAISFGADAVLGVADELVPVTGLLENFTPGDAIDIQNDPITSVTAHGTTNTTLTLYYGSTAVENLTLAGTFAYTRWVLVPDGNDGTFIESVSSTSGGGSGGGQGNTDTLAWANPAAGGAWQHTANWLDVTTGSAALAPPGAENTVELIGGAAAFITIGGPGVCNTLSCWNQVLLQNAFTANLLSIGGTLDGSVTPGIVDIAPSSSITAGNAVADGGEILVEGAAAALSVSGLLTLGVNGDGTLSVTQGGVAMLGGLALAGDGGSSVMADGSAVIEIGTLGGAAAGAVTVDAGCTLSGYGGVNTGGAVIDNGVILASGGTLVLGAVSGQGAVMLGTEATLVLEDGCATGLDLTGAGATLVLAGDDAPPSGVVTGFAAGDAIVTPDEALSAAVFTPGASGVGTLTLFAGQAVAGSLVLAGTYAGDSFAVTPDGAGSEIVLQAAQTGPSQGTATPDDYGWTGNAGTLWNNAANWQDISAGQNPAEVAPGAQDLVTIAGGTSAFTVVTGPADAACLTVQNRVALGGVFGIGLLEVAQGGTLALGAGANISAAEASVAGLALVNGAALTAQDTLTLAGGVVLAEAGGEVAAGSAVLSLPGSALDTDDAGAIVIGSAAAVSGAVLVAAGATLGGLGQVNAAGQVIDDGVIAAGAADAPAGVLALGSVSGSGTLLVGVGDTLALGGVASAGLTIDFAGTGTLAAASLPLAAIADFGTGDAIVLPLPGAASATYVQTGAGIGVLTIDDASGASLGSLTLLGVGAGQTFSIGTENGAAVLTTQQTAYGEGGSGMGTNPPAQGSGRLGFVTDFGWWQSLPQAVQQALVKFQSASGGETWVWTSPSGTGFGAANPADANVAVASAPAANTKIVLPAGYNALLAQGDNPIQLADHSGDVVLYGNSGNDTISTNADGDTLVAGSGGSEIVTTDTGALGTVIYGGGNDSIWTGGSSARITTAANHASQVVVGAAATGDAIDALGRDTIVCAAGTGQNDTVTLAGSDTVFAPSQGKAVIYDGTGADHVVVGGSGAGGGGTVQVFGGTGNNGLLWAGNAAFAEYIGGAGSETIDGGSGKLQVVGGAGQITVFGGSGLAEIQGAAGGDTFVLGTGNASVSAAGGNHVWLASAANDSLIAQGNGCTLDAAGSTGADTFVGALGSVGGASFWAGIGQDVFSFTNGQAGGTYVIYGFNTQADQIDAHGYSQGYLYSVTNGNLTMGLSDGTQIELVGISSITGVNVVFS